MSTYKEWNDHFDRIESAKLKSYIKAIDTLRKDNVIELNYGNDLGAIKAIMNASLHHRK